MGREPSWALPPKPNIQRLAPEADAAKVAWGWKAGIQKCRFEYMAKLPVNPLSWLEPDRRWLYLAARALSHRRLTAGRAKVVREVLLADMEIYDDPRQGVGTWLFENEEELLASLGEHLQAADPAILSGNASHPVRRAAAVLRDRLEDNGTGRPVRNVP